ncbi:GNAT family N-acetyltransferase [Kordiimonas pumila]|uniref:GNAT family N-acetyltransferase n=1 Tax=Kordiimonas pumila TaxID=2161677 RepID=A0ABV7D8A7_9PROT|nr:N-acetyltransferase [Kordiimonas pumila]
MIVFDQERPEDSAVVESLLDAAFGPNRFEKASYKLRINNPPIAEFSYVARDGDRIVGSVRYNKIQVCDLLRGTHINAVLLGPLAIVADRKDQGIGAQLLSRTIAALNAAGHHRILLVGDLAYYQRFGFVPVLPNYITLPGGKDARRLLVRQPESMSALPSVGKIIAGWSEEYRAAMPHERAYISAA